MRFLSVISFAVILGIASGCGSHTPLPALSPYGQADSYGFSDIKIDDRTYEVVYSTPLKAGSDVDELKQVAADVALWRAASLAQSQGYAAVKIISKDTDVENRTRVERGYYDNGYGYGYRPFGYFGYGYGYPYPYRRYPRYPHGWHQRHPYYGYGLGYGLNFGPAPTYREIEQNRVTVRLKVAFGENIGGEAMNAAETAARLKKTYEQYAF